MRKLFSIFVVAIFLFSSVGCGVDDVRPESYAKPEQTTEVLVNVVNLVLDDASGLTRNDLVKDVERFFISDHIGSVIMEGAFKLADKMHDSGYRAHLEIAGEPRINGNKAEVPLVMYVERDGKSLEKEIILYEEKSDLGFWYCTKLNLW